MSQLANCRSLQAVVVRKCECAAQIIDMFWQLSCISVTWRSSLLFLQVLTTYSANALCSLTASMLCIDGCVVHDGATAAQRISRYTTVSAPQRYCVLTKSES
jgi:ribosomal protein L22